MTPSGPRAQPDRFVGLFMSEQRRLLAYAAVLTGDILDAEDVLSDATIVMWEKFASFESGTDFNAWACQIIRYKAMEQRRSRGRGGLMLDERLMEVLADEAESMRDRLDAEFRALSQCLAELSDDDRRLLMKRYDGSTSVGELAASVSRSTVTLRKMLGRLHRVLLRCISRRLAEEPHL